ncbi:hypothetical protein MLP_49380 [Microlunatus phosphovorus NM-1]|uniref:Helix-turn-helix domain-containing protein n=1 Tax=Microlunatus phosphovorus (strain ATCC 700054 / DSM 10555 / JCM 9379 / NBRC 101784 / NCIMB 13414 / VKM Ac-1990 / NM-1) TaxID=1032480 RepID=F5XG18_MICPN|nr:helix-turn-helix domain-containing protein [Microlunatus phosphovorus]BAK37952.1 hypothetical protein MLP_49380 [Microlunatus phosphovorus NM-1]
MAAEATLQTILQLSETARFGVEARARSGRPFVLLRCPAGLSLVTGDVAALDALATAVMDARAALLTACGQVWRCGEDSPDVLQRRYTALGLGWRDPIEEESPGREEPTRRMPGEPPDGISDWLSVEEASELSGVAVTTLKNGEWRRAHGLVADKDSRHRLTFRREDVVALGPPRGRGRPAA